MSTKLLHLRHLASYRASIKGSLVYCQAASPRHRPPSLMMDMLSFHGPAQATPPPLHWSKPSRTPADSDRGSAGRVWLW